MDRQAFGERHRTDSKTMCRFAFVNYKQHFACFECRKVFKKINFLDYLEQKKLDAKFSKLNKCRSKSKRKVLEEKYGMTLESIETQYQDDISKCPECASTLANMGMDFKAPKKSDKKAWKIVAGMYQIGAIYQTCGCNGFGYVPKSQSDYVRYLERILNHYAEYLKHLHNSETLSAFQRQERGAYWEQKISLVEQTLLEATQK